MPVQNIPEDTFISKATFINDNSVEVTYIYQYHFAEKVIVSFDNDFGESELCLAIAELFVLRERLVRGTLDEKKSHKKPKKVVKPISLSLTSNLAKKAINKTLANCFYVKDKLENYSQFSAFWLRNSTFYNDIDRKELLSILETRYATSFHREIFFDRANIFETRYNGLVEITRHALDRAIECSRFARNNLSEKYIVNQILSVFSSKNSCQLEHFGRIKEDKKFYYDNAEFWGCTNQYIRHTLVKTKDRNVIVTIFQRPFVGGEDPNEFIVSLSKDKS